MQLVAYGAQDVYLTGNPQITFFKVVYRRHTNFSMESVQQTWNGPSTVNGQCTATIARNGDLIHKMYIEVSGTAVGGFNNPGAAWITTVELEIGGQRIDRQSGKWMEVWSELTVPNFDGSVQAHAANTAARGTSQVTKYQLATGMGGLQANNAAAKFDVPLMFWFCRNPGLALPLIALQYHEVKVILNHTIVNVFGNQNSNNLWVDYIYLDTDERRRFAQVSHEYLIEQVQEQALLGNQTNELHFNHPVKELIIAGNDVNAANGPGAANFASLGSPIIQNQVGGGPPEVMVVPLGTTLLLRLNGHDRFAARETTYFSRTQIMQHHTGPGGLDSDSGVGFGRGNDGILVYSFALKPEEHQPSGTCNFSRIDTAELVCSVALGQAPNAGAGAAVNPHCYAVNYNVLRIMSGMGGLAYSN